MLVRCPSCNKLYDDESRWTICPHGPLWAAHDAYCPEHDLVNCQVCASVAEQPASDGEAGE